MIADARPNVHSNDSNDVTYDYTPNDLWVRLQMMARWLANLSAPEPVYVVAGLHDELWSEYVRRSS